ncbi:MAG: hypothetical protein ACAH17_00100 [Candidatus Paceibacterota bacterium]
MSRPRFFRKVFDGSESNQKLMTNIEQAVSGAIRSPLLDGRMIEAVAITAGDNRITHKLGRKVRGYIIVKKSGNVDVYDSESDELYLILNSSGGATVSVWVF